MEQFSYFRVVLTMKSIHIHLLVLVLLTLPYGVAGFRLNKLSNATSRKNAVGIQRGQVASTFAIVAGEIGQNIGQSISQNLPMSNHAQEQETKSANHSRRLTNAERGALSKGVAKDLKIAMRKAALFDWSDLPLLVVVACVSWHGVFAVLVVSAVILKYCANVVGTLPGDNVKLGPPRALHTQPRPTSHNILRALSEPASDNETYESILPPQNLFGLKVFVFVSAFITTLDNTIFIPGSIGIAENVGGGLILSGFLLGAYGIGGIFGTFIARYLTHRSLKSAFLCVCMWMFVGNSASLLSLIYPKSLIPWDRILFFSRICCGMELGFEYANQSLIIGVLNPSQDKANRVALFSYFNFFQYSGAALGPAFSAFFNFIGSRFSLPESVLALGFMCVFALLFATVICVWFPCVELSLKASLESASHRKGRVAEEDMPPGVLSQGWAHFIAFNVITYLRHGMRLALEAGSVIVFTQSFGFSKPWASCLITIVMMVSIPGNFILARLIKSKAISLDTEESESSLMQTFLIVQLCGSMGLFSVVGSGTFGFVLFICGSAAFYGVNVTITSFLQGSYYDAGIVGHPILEKQRLLIINTVAIQLGMSAGPIASRALNAWAGVGQNTLAFFIVSNLLWQYLCCRVLKA